MSGFDLEGQVALVTGGGSGIGAAIVRAFEAAGAAVYFTDIADPAESLPSAARFIRADATSETDAMAAVAAALCHNGRLDAAINNVGNFGAGDRWDVPLHATTLEAWDATVRQCLGTTMLGMKAALRPMLAQGSGAIVNIASLAGIRVTRFASPAYTAAKAGVVHLSEQAAVLYAAQGIRVNVVAPGLTLTPNIRASMDPATREAIVAEFHPSGRMVEPDEIADACLWAASARSSAVTGLVIPVDGGWAAR